MKRLLLVLLLFLSINSFSQDSCSVKIPINTAAEFQDWKNKVFQNLHKRDSIENTIEFKNAQNKEASVRLQQLRNTERSKQIIAKFGKQIGYRLIDGETWLGMTLEMLRVSIPTIKLVHVANYGEGKEYMYETDYGTYYYIKNNRVYAYN